jgi:hypothetical protein
MQDEEIKQAVLDLESSVNTDTSKTAEEIKKKAEEIKNHPSVINNNTKLAEIMTADRGGIIGQTNIVNSPTYNY